MAVTINADTSNGLVMTPDTSGEIKLQSAGTDIATVNSSGITMASGKNLVTTAPVFSVWKSSDQSVTSNVATKVTFNNERFDTNSNFASSTFTPTVEGYYQVNATVRCKGTSVTSTHGAFFKNGVELNRLSGSQGVAQAGIEGVSGSAVIYCNGTTDYIEVYAQIIATSPSVGGDGNGVVTVFSGALMRGA
jgi:hypothetical protein